MSRNPQKKKKTEDEKQQGNPKSNSEEIKQKHTIMLRVGLPLKEQFDFFKFFLNMCMCEMR